MRSPTAASYALTDCNWELTLGCTLRCIHCGSRAGKARANEMSLDECLGVADQLAALGCRAATLIGGEVFRFRGWERLAARFAGHGMAVNVVTNGYRVGEPEIEQIRRAALVNVGVSIDGMEANHNLLRGRPDAFRRVRETLDLLATARIPAAAVTCLTRLNLDDLDELYRFLVEHGVRGWQLQLAVAMGNMGERSDLVIERTQVPRVTAFIREKSLEGRMEVVAADCIGYFDENESYIRGHSSPLAFWSGCSAGVSGVFIDSTGNVKGCGSLYDDRFIEGNVRETPLAEIWNDPGHFVYNRQFTPDLLAGKCAGCRFGRLCKAGCRSSNYFATGSLYVSAFCSRA